MADQSSKGDHDKNNSQSEETPFFDKHSGEYNKSDVDAQISKEREEIVEDTQTRSNIHLSGRLSDGKGEDDVEDTQTRANIHISDESSDGVGEEKELANTQSRGPNTAAEETPDDVESNPEEQAQSDDAAVSSGRSTSSIKFAGKTQAPVKDEDEQTISQQAAAKTSVSEEQSVLQATDEEVTAAKAAAEEASERASEAEVAAEKAGEHSNAADEALKEAIEKAEVAAEVASSDNATKEEIAAAEVAEEEAAAALIAAEEAAAAQVAAEEAAAEAAAAQAVAKAAEEEAAAKAAEEEAAAKAAEEEAAAKVAEEEAAAKAAEEEAAAKAAEEEAAAKAAEEEAAAKAAEEEAAAKAAEEEAAAKAAEEEAAAKVAEEEAAAKAAEEEAAAKAAEEEAAAKAAEEEAAAKVAEEEAAAKAAEEESLNEINGTGSNNNISGTEDNDLIDGKGGHDTINGNGGDDVIVGGDGYDTLRGGDGDDTFEVSVGDDYDDYDGGAGTDTIVATEDNVTIGINTHFNPADSIEEISADGHEGVSIAGDNSNNNMDFSETVLTDIDKIDGGTGHDTITGSDGDDVIVGGDGYDTLRGGDGDDTFEVSVGDDYDDYDGGAGTDTIVATEDNVTIGINTHFNPADSIEEISADGHEGVSIAGDNSNNNMDFSETVLTDIDKIDGGTGHDTITGSDGDDVIVGGDGYDTLRGGDGDDTFEVSVGDDYDDYDGGAGTDTIVATEDNVTIGINTHFNPADSIEEISADGHEGVSIAGDNSNNNMDFSETVLTDIDKIDGGTGHDTITGSDGDDVIVGGDGYDTLRGGDGDDTFEVSVGDDYDDYDGGAGTDTIVATEDNVTIGINTHFNPADSIEEISANGHEGVSIAGDNSNNNMDFSETVLTDIDKIDGGTGHDTITGSDGDDVIVGGDGYDTLRGGDGDDTFEVSVGDDYDDYDGGAGTDTIVATEDNVTIGINTHFNPADSIEEISANGHEGVSIAGDNSNNNMDFSETVLTDIDKIDGGTGHDTITGSAGDDVISGGSGTDTVVLSGNQDEYYIKDNEDGTYTIEDTVEGRNGTDTVDTVENLRFADKTVDMETAVEQSPEPPIEEDVEPETVDMEASSFSGSWGQVDAEDIGWQTDNDDNKIEVGLETTYGGSDSSNVVLELEADSGDQSNLYKDFDTSPGDVVDVAFDYSARGGRSGEDCEVEVYWEGELIDTITPDGGFGWENHSYELEATMEGSRLEFQATDSNSMGGLIDNIEVSISDEPVEAGVLAVEEDKVVEGTVGAEDIVGGSGDDTLMFNADSTWAGYSAHNVETGETVGIGGSNRSSDVFDGGDGYDTIEGTSGDDTLFIDDSFSDFASEKQARIQDVEEINMGDGDDIVDMTSSTYTYDQGIKVDGGDGNDTIWTSTGDDQINGGAGDDSIYGGDGDDTLTFLAHQGNDVVDGGEGGSWTDTLELGGFDGQGSQEGWTLSLNDGSTVTSTDELNGEMLLSDDAGGTISFDDGGTVDFENIEKIVW